MWIEFVDLNYSKKTHNCSHLHPCVLKSIVHNQELACNIAITFETNCTISFEQEKRQAKTTNDIICNHYHYDNQSRWFFLEK